MTVSEDRLPSLVVTADDFGISPSVDQGILLSHNEGIVSTTALMLSFPELEGSVRQLADAPDLDLGVHLDLTCGTPVAGSRSVPSLVAANGRFHRFKVLAARLAAGRVSQDEIRTEWMAQIEMGLGLGCRFTSISSHQHVHMLPGLDAMAAQMALTYEIPFVRLTDFAASRRRGSSPIKTWALLPFASRARRTFDRPGLAHNEAAMELDLKATDPVAALFGCIEGLGSAVCELVCHPGYVDDVLEGRDPYTAPREAELEVLTTPGLRERLAQNGVNLTTYAALAPSGCRHDQGSKTTP